MSVNALLFGSVGVLVETSEMQRRAFHAAFADAGLNWDWDRDTYAQLLKSSGGANRIASYAAVQGETVDAEAIHAAKVNHFERLMADEGLTLRPGIRDLMDEAANRAIPIGWVTDTGQPQLDAIIQNLGTALHRDEFRFIGSDVKVKSRKPAPDIYLAALETLQVSADQAIAIEDTAICARAAVSAAIPTYGFPNDFADPDDFPESVEVVAGLTLSLLDRVRAAA